jgi:Fe-S-cluster containining protein
MQHPIVPLNRNQRFCFTCSPHVTCFNACCRDLNQVLTPYDVLCLKQHLKMTSAHFLAEFTQTHTGPETGLPVVSLRFSDDKKLACPFVTATGCRVYPARPASCRIYPLARGVSRNRETGEMTEHWALIRETHCLGFLNGKSQNVDQWVQDQQLAAHNLENDRMLALISEKNRHRPGPLTPTASKQVYTALYDLDTFRDRLPSIDDIVETADGPQVIAHARRDELALLHLAMDWVRKAIFTGLPQDR